MRIDKTIILEPTDIFDAIKMYLGAKLGTSPDTVCNFHLVDATETSKQQIRVVIQQEKL